MRLGVDEVRSRSPRRALPQGEGGAIAEKDGPVFDLELRFRIVQDRFCWKLGHECAPAGTVFHA